MYPTRFFRCNLAQHPQTQEHLHGGAGANLTWAKLSSCQSIQQAQFSSGASLVLSIHPFEAPIRDISL